MSDVYGDALCALLFKASTLRFSEVAERGVHVATRDVYIRRVHEKIAMSAALSTCMEIIMSIPMHRGVNTQFSKNNADHPTQNTPRVIIMVLIYAWTDAWVYAHGWLAG